MSDGITALGHASSWIINLERALSQAEKELSAERAARQAAEQMLAEISSILEVSPGEDIVKVVRTTNRELTRWEGKGQDALAQLAAERAARQEAEEEVGELRQACKTWREDAAKILNAADAYRDLVVARDQQLAARDQQLAARDQQLAARDQQLAARDQAIAAGGGVSHEVQPVPEWAKRRPARRFRLGMDPTARFILAEQERDEAEQQLAALREEVMVLQIDGSAYDTGYRRADDVARTRITELEQQLAALREGLVQAETALLAYRLPAGENAEQLSRRAGDAITKARALLASPAADQQQPADDWSDTLPDSARRERRRTVQQPGDQPATEGDHVYMACAVGGCLVPVPFISEDHGMCHWPYGNGPYTGGPFCAVAERDHPEPATDQPQPGDAEPEGAE